ncbi:MAG: ABC transporter substrate-binding protein [Cyanobacteria bacterium J06598_3]
MTTQPRQDVAVVIDFLEGNFKKGFKVSLEILKEGTRTQQTNDLPRLPPAPELPALYRIWQSRYIAMGAQRELRRQLSSSRSIQPVANQPTHKRSAVQDCRAAANALEDVLSDWFKSDSFQRLRDKILAVRLIQEEDAVPVIFNFRVPEANQLRRLPWHVWDLFRIALPNAEVVLQAKIAPKSAPSNGPLKVLAIYGSPTQGISTEEDRAAWQSLASRQNVSIVELDQPTQSDVRKALSGEPWDILFFAGHSSSAPMDEHGAEGKDPDEGSFEEKGLTSKRRSQTGTLQIGVHDDGRPRLLAIAQIESALKTAVKNGLKLAIFNSCDGLGIADWLSQLKMPTTIVMREPVADLVARRFIQKFLQHFSEHQQFYQAVRAARHELDWLEKDFDNPLPSATWMPIVLQNPSHPAPQWPVRAKPKAQKRLPIIVGTAIVCSAVIGLSQYLTRPKTEAYGSSISHPATSIGYTRLTPKTTGGSPDKEACNAFTKDSAIANMSAGKYQTAEEQFTTFARGCPSDPETQIYRNNAAVLKAYLAEGTNLTTASAEQLKTLKNNVLIIAVVVPLRGEATGTAQEILRGVVAAQQRHNAQNTNYKIVLQIANDDTPEDLNLSDQAATVAKVLVKDPAVFAVVGHYSSGATAQAASIYTQANVVAISPSSTAIRTSSTENEALKTQAIDLNDNIFRTSPNDSVNAAALVQDLKQENITHVLIAYDQGNEYSRSLKAVMVETLQENGITLEHTCNFSAPGAFNPNSCLNQAPNAKALLFFPTAEVRLKAGTLMRELPEEIRVWAGDAAYSSSNFNSWGDRISGTRFAIPWHEKSPLNDGNVFGKNEGKSWRSAMAYDALQAIAAGISQQIASSQQPLPTATNRRELSTVLAAEDFTAEGIGGEGSVRFDKWGDRATQSDGTLTLIVEVVPTGDGQYITRPVVQTIQKK